MKKVGIITLFILICAGTSLALMEVLDETTDKIKGFYFVENTDGESHMSLDPGKEGRTISDERLDEPIVVDEPLSWFMDPFSSEDGSSGKGFFGVAKKYGLFVVLSAACLIWYLRRKKKNKKTEGIPETSNTPYTFKTDQSESVVEQPVILTEEKLNEIRQMMKDWETHLSILNRKKNHETIQEWFKRIKGPTEVIPLYEKVRYGGKSFTNKELQLLKKFLR